MTRILIAGRSAEYVLHLQPRIAELGPYETQINVLSNGVTNPLTSVEPLPDILVLVVTDNQVGELETLAQENPAQRVPLVVIGDQLEPGTMRLAMQAGARDFLSADADEEQLADTLRQLVAETDQHARNTDSTIVSVVNAAGGNGASTVAVNLAAGLAGEQTGRVAAIDLDLQNSCLAKYFDKEPEHSLIDALERIEEIDVTALSGYYTETSCGVDLASAHATTEIQNRDLLDEPFSRFLDMGTAKYDWLVVDIPGQLDALSAATLEVSQQIVIVLQQNLKSIHQASCLLEMMRQHLTIAPERISLVVNRYHKNAALEIKDVKRVVKSDPVFAIPNDFDLVSQCNELGRPFYSEQENSPQTAVIRDLLVHFGAASPPPPSGFFGRKLSGLLRT